MLKLYFSVELKMLWPQLWFSLSYTLRDRWTKTRFDKLYWAGQKVYLLIKQKISVINQINFMANSIVK